MKINLNIVHPCYNPKNGWEKELVKSHTMFIARIPDHIVVQLILVNDGSTKGISQDHIDYIQSKIPHVLYINNPVNSGKGFALRSAIKHAQDGLIIYTDVDHPYKMENSLEMFRILNDGKCDVVVGIRTKDYFKRLPFSRVVFSLSLRLANHLFLPRLFVKDTQSGLKGFNQKGKDVFLKTRVNGFLFDTEFIRLCSKEKLRMEKIPLQLNEGITFTPIKYKVIKREILNFIGLLND